MGQVRRGTWRVGVGAMALERCLSVYEVGVQESAHEKVVYERFEGEFVTKV